MVDNSICRVVSLTAKSPEKEFFNTAKQAFTPKFSKINNVHYKKVDERESMAVAPHGSISRPNYEDNLRRVSVVINQHISKCENLLDPLNHLQSAAELKIQTDKINKFSEENYLSPEYTYRFVRSPIARMGFLYGIIPLKFEPKSPTLTEIHTFLYDLFTKAHLTAECSIGMYFSLIFLSILILIFKNSLFNLC